MNRLAPLIARPERSAFDPAGVVLDPPMDWPAEWTPPATRDLAADARLFLGAWAAGMVVFTTLFA